jgi:hypothetical protein
MTASKYLLNLTVLLAIGALEFYPNTLAAEDAVPGDKRLVEGQAETSGPADGTSSRSPRSPIRLNSFDYQDNGDQAGKLRLAGIALPGNDLYIYFDNQPLSKVIPDEGGKWSLESEMKLGDGRHTIRAEQYDPNTRILAARAMVSIERAKQPPDGPPKTSAP